jgi:hypothetical protein
MNVSEYYLTENKKNKDNQNSKNKKDILSDIKKNLYQELTTQSSLKLKYRDYDESSFKNSKYINYFNLKNDFLFHIGNLSLVLKIGGKT